jgi:hypothetical protein
MPPSESVRETLTMEKPQQEIRQVGIRLTHQAAIPSMRGWKTILGT